MTKTILSPQGNLVFKDHTVHHCIVLYDRRLLTLLEINSEDHVSIAVAVVIAHYC